MKKLKFLILFMFLLQIWSNMGLGQSEIQNIVDDRLKRASKMQTNNASEALELMKNTLDFAIKKQDKNSEWKTCKTIGFFYLNNSQFDDALAMFQKSITVAKEMNDANLEGLGLMNVGNAYMRLERFEKSKKHYIKALKIFQKSNNRLYQAKVIGNLGNVNTALGLSDEGLRNFTKAYEIFDELEEDDSKSSMNLNIGYFYLMNGQGEAALPYVIKGLEYGLAKRKTDNIAMGYGNLGYAYSLIGDYQQAFSNYQHCVDTAQKYGYTRIEYDTYKDMSETYQKSGNPIKAMEYLSMYYILKDSIIGQKTQERVSELEIRFQTANQEREINEFKQQERIRNLQIWLLAIGLILLSVIGLLVFQKQRSDIRKKQALIAKNGEIHRLEKELIEKELKQKALEQQKIEEELAYKTSRLTDFAIDIAQKNDFSNEVMNRLDCIENLRLSKKVSDELRRFRIYVSSQLQINDGVSHFQQNVDAVNLEFNRKLEQRFPDLSKKDLILCGLLRLNLQNKEIATLRNVSSNAIKMARYRLRKKLGLTASDDIVDLFAAKFVMKLLFRIRASAV